MTGTFTQDTSITPNAVGLSLTLFSATYVPFHPINTVLSFIVGPRLWIALQLLVCGILCTAHAAITGNAGLIGLRLALGAAEAGYNPCCLFLMSRFFPRHNLGLRMGFFTCMFALAGAIAGVLTYGLLSAAAGRLSGWQLVFLVEGILPMVNAAVVWLMVPRNLETAWFLSAEERAHAVMRMRADRGGSAVQPAETQLEPNATTRGDTGRVTWRDFTDVMRDFKKLLTIFFGILIITSMNAFPAFLPVLVEGMGFSGPIATVMSVPPFVTAIVAQMIGTWLSDHYRQRAYVIEVFSLCAAVAALVMAASPNDAVRFAASHVCVSGVMMGSSLISVWLANNTPESVRKKAPFPEAIIPLMLPSRYPGCKVLPPRPERPNPHRRRDSRPVVPRHLRTHL